MKYLELASQDVMANLATEDYLLNNCDEDLMLIWSTDDCVTVGRSQNVFAEINVHEADRQEIRVARRITDGGALFCDKGNLNYTFIVNKENCPADPRERYVMSVVAALQGIGLDAVKMGKGSIYINGKKVSDSSEAETETRLIHTGTLLFGTYLDFMTTYLKQGAGDFKPDRALSKPARTADIKDFLPEDSDYEYAMDLKKVLLDTVFPDGFEKYELTMEQLGEIRTITDEKFRNWQWVYGENPKFVQRVTCDFMKKPTTFSVTVDGGVVESCEAEGNDLAAKACEVMEGAHYSHYQVDRTLQNGGVWFTEAKTLCDALFAKENGFAK